MINRLEMLNQQRVTLAARVNTLRDAPPDQLVPRLGAFLATHPDPSVRDGEEAVRWATHAHLARGGTDAPTMLVLATALAEAGRFERAIDVGTAALQPAREARSERLVRELQRRIALFEARQAYHYGD